MESKKLKPIDIIEDTLKFYSVNPLERRSITLAGTCLYSNNGKKCAVGRYMKIDFNNNYHLNVESISSLLESYEIDRLLDDKVSHIKNIHFWSDLQLLHDISSHWSDTGITEDGIEYYEYLKDRYKDE